MTLSDRWWPVLYAVYGFALAASINNDNWFASISLYTAAMLAIASVASTKRIPKFSRCTQRLIVPFIAAGLSSRIAEVWSTRSAASRWSTLAGAFVIVAMGIKATIDSEAARRLGQ